MTKSCQLQHYTFNMLCQILHYKHQDSTHRTFKCTIRVFRLHKTICITEISNCFPKGWIIMIKTVSFRIPFLRVAIA